MQDIQDPVLEEPVTEEFTWFHNSWDITRLLKAVDAKTLRPSLVELDRDFIESFAEQVMGLVKDAPADAKNYSIMVALDLPRARAMPLETLKKPLVLLHAGRNGILRMPGSDKPEYILGDGNHRLALAYYNDVQTLPAYQLSKTQSSKFLC